MNVEHDAGMHVRIESPFRSTARWTQQGANIIYLCGVRAMRYFKINNKSIQSLSSNRKLLSSLSFRLRKRLRMSSNSYPSRVDITAFETSVHVKFTTRNGHNLALFALCTFVWPQLEVVLFWHVQIPRTALILPNEHERAYLAIRFIITTACNKHNPSNGKPSTIWFDSIYSIFALGMISEGQRKTWFQMGEGEAMTQCRLFQSLFHPVKTHRCRTSHNDCPFQQSRSITK